MLNLLDVFLPLMLSNHPSENADLFFFFPDLLFLLNMPHYWGMSFCFCFFSVFAHMDVLNCLEIINTNIFMEQYTPATAGVK